MMVFLDTSVLVRKLFGEPGQWGDWAKIEHAVASRLLVVECMRVIDRHRLAGHIGDDDVAHVHEQLRVALRSIELVHATEKILSAASAPMPTTLGTLDAIHLASALAWTAARRRALTFATHDEQLARAARASGFAVAGI